MPRKRIWLSSLRRQVRYYTDEDETPMLKVRLIDHDGRLFTSKWHDNEADLIKEIKQSGRFVIWNDYQGSIAYPYNLLELDYINRIQELEAQLKGKTDE